jgi:hypothetical protein
MSGGGSNRSWVGAPVSLLSIDGVDPTTLTGAQCRSDKTLTLPSAVFAEARRSVPQDYAILQQDAATGVWTLSPVSEWSTYQRSFKASGPGASGGGDLTVRPTPALRAESGRHIRRSRAGGALWPKGPEPRGCEQLRCCLAPVGRDPSPLARSDSPTDSCPPGRVGSVHQAIAWARASLSPRVSNPPTPVDAKSRKGPMDGESDGEDEANAAYLGTLPDDS